MAETSLSLLDRLHCSEDRAAWQRLTELYSPLIRHWVCRFPLQASDADDLVQEVLAVVVAKVAAFVHDGRPSSFRSWLRAISVNRMRDYWRARCSRDLTTGSPEFIRMLEELHDPHSGVSRLWEQEHDHFVLRRLLELIEPEFKPTTWEAFRRHVIGGEPADAVASALGVTPNVVFITKSRVLQRLREEARGLIDDLDPDLNFS